MKSQCYYYRFIDFHLTQLITLCSDLLYKKHIALYFVVLFLFYGVFFVIILSILNVPPTIRFDFPGIVNVVYCIVI